MFRYKVKDWVTPELLEEIGFKSGNDLEKSGDPRYVELFDGCGYMGPWMHIFDMWETDDEIEEIDEEYEDDKPIYKVHCWINSNNELWFDAWPCCTYHIGMDELNLITDVVAKMTAKGYLYRVDN